MYLHPSPLLCRKYVPGTFLGVNVICPLVMYTNKVLRWCHMLMLAQTSWVAAIKGLAGNCLWISSVLGMESRGEQMVFWKSASGKLLLLFVTVYCLADAIIQRLVIIASCSRMPTGILWLILEIKPGTSNQLLELLRKAIVTIITLLSEASYRESERLRYGSGILLKDAYS